MKIGWPSRAATAQRILEAARAEFGERGLDGATIRRIAQRAQVDPSLVMQHYGSKAALFAVAIELGESAPDEIEAHLRDVLDVRLGTPRPRRPGRSCGPCSPRRRPPPR